MTLRLIAFPFVALMLLPSFAAAGGRTAREEYIGPVGGGKPPTCGFPLLELDPPNVGGACFDVLPGEMAVSLLIRDNTNYRIEGFYTLWDDIVGDVIGSGFFCNEVDVALPPEAVRVEIAVEPPGWPAPVSLDPPGLNPGVCVVQDPPATSLGGIIWASFS